MAATLTEGSTSAAAGGRLWTIDALRGVAALGVMMFHASDPPGMVRSRSIEQAVDFVLNNGRYGVWLFFVISGFCIHLRWASRAARGDDSTPDFISFWKRRFRRLYPAYLAALVIFVALRLAADTALTPRFVRDVILHVLLVQNNVPGGSYAINEVFWTLAIEEQLYLLYFVFLAVRRRYGWATMLTVAIVARIGWFAFAFAVHRAFGWDIVVTQMALVQWIVWILGALSVEAWFGVVTLPRVFSSRWLGAAGLAVASTASYAYLYLLPDGAARDTLWLIGDVLWGLAFFIVINATVLIERERPGVAGRWLAGVGLYSYSLYLTHEIITFHGWRALVRVVGVPPMSSLVLIPVLAAASLVLARMFFVVFERPFLSPSRTRQASRA